MRARILSVIVVLIVVGGLWSGATTAITPVDAAATSSTGQNTTTLADQADLSVTVYNSDIALVRDVRNLRLPGGTFDLQFMDIAATVNPATVHFRSLTDPGAVGVLEQNYEYDLLEPDKLLRKYVGRDVTLVRIRHDGSGSREEEVRARLLSYNNGPVWQIGKEIVTGYHADHMRFPELPGNLHSRPTLIWTLQNRGDATHRVEASYLAGKLAWNADYVLTVGRDDKAADLDGWVTLTNGSGTAFNNAKLQLVAGDLNRVRQQLERRKEMGDAMSPRAAAAEMQQEAFSDYHLYTLGRRTTINNNETKQVSMLTGTAVPTLKRYVVNGQHYYYRNAHHPGAPLKDLVQVFYQFRNDQKNGLEGRDPLRRRGPHQPHAERRDDQHQDRQRVRRRLRAEADRLPQDRARRLRVRVRDHAAEPQGERRVGRNQRADRRHVEHAALVTHVDEDRRVGVAVHRAGRRGQRSGAAVSGARDVLVERTREM